MNCKTTFAALALTLLLAPAAQARFIMFDANFDNRPVGSSLDRRGAAFGEPIEATGDNHTEVIVQDGPGDRSVQVLDTSANAANDLTFALLYGTELVDGKLNVAIELQPDTVDVYKVAIEGPDTAARWFFDLTLDGAGFLYWADGDDLAVTQFGTYAAGDLLQVVLAFDLNAGTYDFTLDGVPILTNEAFGITTYGIAHIVAGNQFDGNATGSVRLDNLEVDYVPGTAEDLLTANFDNEPIGQPIGTGGAALGQPFEYTGCVPTVQNGGGFATPSLRIDDESTTQNCPVLFGFLDDAEVTGDVSISFWTRFDSLEDFDFYIREQGSSARRFLNLAFRASGDINFSDEASGIAVYHQETYAASTPIHVEVAIYGAQGLYSVWLDGVRVVHRRAHGVTDRGVGRLIFGPAYDPDLDGRMRVDTIRVDTLIDPLTPVADEVPPGPALASLVAAPNPFNPATSLRFSLPQAGQVQIDVIDLAGRRVQRVVDQQLGAGDHEATWRGTDTAGQPLASGVYQALLRVDGRFQQRLPLTLLK